MFPNEIEGFGLGASQSDVDALNKALSSGYAATTSMTGGAALRVESLEQTLKVTSFKDTNCVLFKSIPKSSAYSTVEEFSELSAYGSTGNAFVPEGTLPESDDSTYQRRASLVKFLGTTRQVTHQMTLVRTIVGDAIARETVNGTLKIMRDAEDALFWGNANLGFTGTAGGAGAAITDGTGIEWDGLNALIGSTDDVDLGNTHPDEATLSEAAEKIASNYGNPTDIFMSYKVAKILSQTMLPKERIALPVGADGGLSAGSYIASVVTNFGRIKVNPDVFLGTGRSPKKTRTPSQAADNANCPTAVTLAESQTGSTGVFRSGQYGVIKAIVTPCNRYGEGAATAATSGVTVNSGNATQHIVYTVTMGAGTIDPEWYNLYVTEAGGSIYYLVGQFACDDQTASTGDTAYTYTGYIMPNTSIAFMGEMSPEILTLKQLAPLMKMDLALLAPAYRFMVLYYAVPQLFAPRKWMRIVNIKDV